MEDQARKEPVLFFGRRCLRFYELFDPARRSRATIILSPPSAPHLVPSHHIRHPFTTVSYDRPNKFIFPSPPIPLSSLSFRSILLAAPFSSSIVHFLRHEFSRSIIAQQRKSGTDRRSF